MCQGKERLNFYMSDYQKTVRFPVEKGTGYAEGYEDRAGNVCTWIRISAD